MVNFRALFVLGLVWVVGCQAYDRARYATLTDGGDADVRALDAADASMVNDANDRAPIVDAARCQADSDCTGSAEGAVCDVASGRCGQCTTARDSCPSGQACDATTLRCMTSCQTDDQCPSTAPRCEPSTHRCVRCLDAAECGPGNTCASNRCVASCDGMHACASGTCCGGACLDTRNDTANCGGCGLACAFANAGASCVQGACVLGACSSGFANCDGNSTNGCEVDIARDPAHCGTCTNTCTAGFNATPSCASGSCGIACNPGFDNCDGNASNGCEASLTSPSSCGGCMACPSAQPLCTSDGSGAHCTSGCATGQTLCGGSCATLASDPNNCGTCGTICRGATNAVGVCNASVCAVQCVAGYGDCDGTFANGCETSVTTLANCGGCGTGCTLPNATGTTCATGTCTAVTCAGGFGDCDSIASNGCETDVRTAVAHCGACGSACVVPANAAATCTAGACGFTCNRGFADCDGNAANGCEADLDGDPMHCGGCANVCTVANATAACSSGVCEIGSCNARFADCDTMATNGCETNLDTSAASCGACGRACASPNTCTGGTCQCIAPAMTCGAACIATNSDPANCGACGTACPALPNAAPGCAGGACGVGTCQTGWGNCNGLAPDGCEFDVSADNTRCGSCSRTCTSSQTCRNSLCGTNVAGDRCVNPISIPNAPYGIDVTARAELPLMAHDTNPPCGVGTADAWFRFTVQTRDVVYADTRGSIGDTILAIYRSCTTPYAQSQIGEVVCSDDAMGSGCSPTPLSQVVAVLDPGAYYLLVSTRAGTPAGSATVHFQHLQAPVYDHWAPRGYATSRSLQPGPSMYQGVCAPGFTGEDMYWWTTCLVSPQNTVTVNVCANGGADPVLLLLAGAAGGGGVVTCRDNGGGCSAQSPGTVFGQQLPGLNAALVDGNNPGSYTIDINQ